MSLATRYMGLDLANPVIVSSSGLTGSVEGIVRCAEGSAGAIVVKSLYEEQIHAEADAVLERSHLPMRPRCDHWGPRRRWRRQATSCRCYGRPSLLHPLPKSGHRLRPDDPRRGHRLDGAARIPSRRRLPRTAQPGQEFRPPGLRARPVHAGDGRSRADVQLTPSQALHSPFDVINTADNGKSYWNRAGIAFENKDGSFTLKLDILPQTKFQLREEEPAANAEAAE